jgi:hypothetical protein
MYGALLQAASARADQGGYAVCRPPDSLSSSDPDLLSCHRWLADKIKVGNMRQCHRCKKEMVADEKVGRRDFRPFCRAGLHGCRNCQFYDPGSYNQCRDTQAERFLEKDRSNFCEYFVFRDTIPGIIQDKGKEDDRARLNLLFKI